MEENLQKNMRDSDVAISSRIRLARNIGNMPFPPRMDASQSLQVVKRVRDVVFQKDSEQAGNFIFADIQKLNSTDRQLLVEKHLISPDFIEGRRDRAAIISRDERISIMVNEEDHLRLQCILPGKQLDEAWKLCGRIEELLEEKLEFAFDPAFGYLTCCPTNIGTGIRASVMLHLPAITMAGYINSILEACGKLGVAVRGMYGENSEALGNMYQISNQVTLGHTEEEIIASVNNVASQIIEQERALRNELYKLNPIRFEDRVFRSLGLFANARILSSDECFKLLSDVRVGIDMGIIEKVGIEVINELMLYIQPAHLQKLTGRPLNPEERDIMRAEIIRRRLNELE